MEAKNGDAPRDDGVDGVDALPRFNLKEDHAPPADDAGKVPKKRRKVNHGTRAALPPPVRRAGRLTASLRSCSLRLLPSICKSPPWARRVRLRGFCTA